MEQFYTDLETYLRGYYDSFVALLPRLVIALLLVTLIWGIARRTRQFARKRLHARVDDPLLADFLAKLIRTTLNVVGLLIALWVIGLGGAAASILAGAGISAFIIGFAFKDIGENFLAGILMAFKRPFRLGDTVEVGEQKGTIIGLSLRDTHIKTFDGKDVFIPNGGILKQPIINYTLDGFLRHDFEVGLDYGSDVEGAIRVILDTLREVPGILHGPKQSSIMISTLAPSTLNLRVFYWLDTFDKEVSALTVKNQAVERTLHALDAAGYYLPGDILELKNYRQDRLGVEGVPATQTG